MIHHRKKQSDLMLNWEMFHKIYHRYSDIKNKEGKNAALLLTSMSDHKYMNKFNKTTVNPYENNQNEFPFQVRKIVPTDLHHIQLRVTQVWNCD